MHNRAICLVAALAVLGGCEELDPNTDGGLTSDGSAVNPAPAVDGATIPPDSGIGQPPVGDGAIPPILVGDGGLPASDAGTADTGAPPVAGGNAPTLPPITGECPEFKSGTATIGGLSNITLVVGPKKQGTGALVFYWHGTGSSAAEFNSMLPRAVRDEITANGGIIVSPQGSTGMGGDCSGTGIFSKSDFAVADLIAACAVRDHGIDPRRIYTTGCSAGGLQAGCMASLRSSYVAAAVPNSGGIVFPQMIQDASHIPSIMTMHGGSSDNVGVAFSDTSKRLDDQFKAAGGYVINCNHGGGHCRAPAELQSAGWEFMKAHPFGVAPEPYTSGIPQTFPSYCMAH